VTRSCTISRPAPLTRFEVLNRQGRPSWASTATRNADSGKILLWARRLVSGPSAGIERDHPPWRRRVLEVMTNPPDTGGNPESDGPRCAKRVLDVAHYPELTLTARVVDRTGDTLRLQGVAHDQGQTRETPADSAKPSSGRIRCSAKHHLSLSNRTDFGIRALSRRSRRHGARRGSGDVQRSRPSPSVADDFRVVAPPAATSRAAACVSSPKPTATPTSPPCTAGRWKIWMGFSGAP